MGQYAYYVSLVLLLITAAGASYSAWRHRDTHRLNILAVVLAALASLVPTKRSEILLVLILAQPFFLLRLVQHFREVNRLALLATPVLALVGIAAVLVPMPVDSRAVSGPVIGYGSLAAALAASYFTREAGRTAGVTKMRLVFAGVGSLALAGVFLIGAGSTALVGNRMLSDLMRSLNAIVAISYFLAFNPPRALRARWQRTEQARYLSDVAGRDVEERGLRAADDLKMAAERSLGNAAVVVALGSGEPDSDVIVRVASGVALGGAAISPQPDRLVGRACQSRLAAIGTPAEAEPELARAFAPIGSSLLVAPIVASAHIWGVVLVAQRRGSLFPDDDLRLLAQLARYAGTALDHARLVAEARARERLVADRRVHAAESLMSLTLDSIKDYAMCLCDADGRIVAWHAGAEQLFGYTGAEIAGEPALAILSLESEAFHELLARANREGHATHEGMCRRRDGSRFVGATLIRPLQREPTDPRGFVAVTRDVTEQRELESRLRQSQKMEAVGQLAGGIAHDFNNLLTAILGNADFLASRLGPEMQTEVGDIQKAAERAANLTRQLLTFSRKRMLEPVAVNLATLVDDMLPMLRRVIGEQIEIVHVPEGHRGTVLGDRSQIEQIVLNLAVNARDAMPAGGLLTLRTAEVQVDEAGAAGELTPGPHVALEVVDTGTGMDPATRARIFEPFFTTKEFGAGTGLGLATVYGIVKQMGGAIRVDTEPGRGTTFRLLFPATAEREAADRTAAPRELPRGSETVLLVEDDDVVRTFLSSTLKRYGYKVLTAGHPAAALAIAQGHPDVIHLLITDVVMPGTSGPELARSVETVRPGMPTLFISGYADAVLARQGVVPKATQFLQKPFSAADLLTRVRQIMQS